MRILLLFAFLLPFCFAQAETKDSIPSQDIEVVKGYSYNKSYTKRIDEDIDTAIDLFHNYQPNSSISDYQMDLGYYGSPNFSLLEPFEYSQAFFINPVSLQMNTVENAKFYNTTKPFSVLTYSSGKYEEQNVSFLHTQNYSKDLNAGIRMRFYKSLGEYIPQGAAARHISPWVSYTGDKYSIHVLYNYNVLTHDENGGLVDDSAMYTPQLIQIQLEKAKAKKEYYDAQLIQKWNISNSKLLIDSNRIEMPIYKYAVGHSIYYNKTKFSYTDASIPDDFYPRSLYDTVSTNDTSETKNITNTVFIESNLSKNDYNAIIHFGLGQEYISQYYKDYTYQFPQTDWYLPFFETDIVYSNKLFDIEHNHRYYLLNKPEFESNTDFNLQLAEKEDKELTLHLAYELSRKDNYGALQTFNSNHAIWNNDFKQVFRQKISGDLQSDWYNIKLQASILQINNIIYFTNDVSLKQLDGRSFVSQVSISKHTELGSFQMDNSLTYQKVESRAFDLPKYASYNSLYYKGKMYRKLIQCKIGLEGLWFSKYNANSYLPSLGVFAQQDQNLYGDYPIVNAFLSLKYKPIRVLIKYNGLYSIIFEKNFNTIHYPQQTGYIAFAVSWNFYN